MQASVSTVLIVDDDVELRTGARLRLNASGYRTLEASDGNQGVQMALEHHPDAILLDIRMPGMDGLTALKELQSHEATADIPVVMLSASHVDQVEALDGGAKYFLSKPYVGPQVVAAIEAAIEARVAS